MTIAVMYSVFSLCCDFHFHFARIEYGFLNLLYSSYRHLIIASRSDFRKLTIPLVLQIKVANPKSQNRVVDSGSRTSSSFPLGENFFFFGIGKKKTRLTLVVKSSVWAGKRFVSLLS